MLTSLDFALPGVTFSAQPSGVRAETTDPRTAQRLVLQAWERGYDVRQSVDDRGVQVVEWAS